MKLLTLNTHSLIEPAYEAKRDAFVEFIRKEQPDVFALQEVNQTAAAPLLADVDQSRCHSVIRRCHAAAAAGRCPGGVLPLPRQYGAAESG